MLILGQCITLLAAFFTLNSSFKALANRQDKIQCKKTGIEPKENPKRDLAIQGISICLSTIATLFIPLDGVKAALLFIHHLSAETAPWLLFALGVVVLIKRFAPEKKLVGALLPAEQNTEAKDNPLLNQLATEGALEPTDEKPKLKLRKRKFSFKKWLKPSAFISALLASVILPICSCAIIPIAKGLRDKGLPKRETTLFTVLTPEMSIDAFFMRAAMMGWPFAIATLVSSFFTAIFAAIGVDFADKKIGDKEQYADSKLECKNIKKHTELTFYWAFRYALIEILDDLAIIIFVSLVISGYMSFYLSAEVLASFGLSSGLFTMIVVVIIGIPIYVCASESTPLGVGMLAAGFSPGAVAAFFIAGPATNATTFAFARGALGKYCSYVFFSIIAVSAIGFGLLTDWVFDWFQLPIKQIKPEETSPGWFANVCLLLVISASVYAVWTTRVLNKGWDHGIAEK